MTDQVASSRGPANLEVRMTLNGRPVRASVEARTLLVHAIRDTWGLTGAKVGCDTSQCGACTVLVDGDAVKSCTILAAQADGAVITTVEGLAPSGGDLHPLQREFRDHHALQCGFCTPGMIMTAADLLARDPHPGERAVREALEGNICRCTGYETIVDAVLAASGGLPDERLRT